MTFRRIALIAVSLLALSGCVVYDEDSYHHGFRGGYHHGYSDRHDWR